jgi:hypothetical protein
MLTHRLHGGMRSERAPHLRAAVHDAQRARGDERAHARLEVRPRPLIHGVHLQHAHRAVHQALQRHVSHGHHHLVARAQHEAHLARAAQHRGAADSARICARLHPELAGVAVEEQVLKK